LLLSFLQNLPYEAPPLLLTLCLLKQSHIQSSLRKQ